LIGSARANVQTACRSLLMQAGYGVLPALRDEGELLRAVQNQRPDLVLLDYRIEGRNGLQLSELIEGIPVVVMMPPAQMGVISGHSAGQQNRHFVGLDFSRRAILQTIAFALDTDERIRALEEQIQQLYRQIDDKRDATIAKSLLMNQLHLPEQDAHRLLQKNSMEKSVSVRDLVQDILKREGAESET